MVMHMNMKINTKLIISSFLTIFLLVIAAFFSYFSFNEFLSKPYHRTETETIVYENLQKFNSNMNQVTTDFLLLSMNTTSNKRELEEEIMKKINQMDKYIEKANTQNILYEFTSSENREEDNQKLNSHWEEYKALMIRFMEEDSIDTRSLIMKNKEFQVIIDDISNKKLTNISELNMNYVKMMTFTLVFYILLIFVSIVFFSIFNSSLYKSIIDPIKDMVKMTKKVGDGDLLDKSKVFRKDEMGILSNSFNFMIEKIIRLVKDIQSATFTIDKSSNNLLQVSNEIVHITEHSIIETDKLKYHVKEQELETHENIDRLNSISNFINQIAASTNDVKISVYDITEKAKLGKTSMENVENQMNLIIHTFEQVSNIIKRLESRSNLIKEIISLIQSIASQTNILALNTTIEAERAGEEARGFQIISFHIKKLADETRISTNKISNIVKEILEDTELAVQYVRETESNTKEGSLLIMETKDKLTNILLDTERVLHEINNISNDTNLITLNSSDIEHSIEKMNELFNHSSKQSIDSFERLNSKMKQVYESVNDLKVHSNYLNQTIESFKTN